MYVYVCFTYMNPSYDVFLELAHLFHLQFKLEVRTFQIVYIQHLYMYRYLFHYMFI